MTQMQLNCPLSREDSAGILLDDAAGRLDRSRSARLERHIETCPACAAFRAEQSALWSVLDGWETAGVSTDFDRRIWQRIDEMAAVPWYRRFARLLHLPTWKPVIPLSAAAAIIAVGFLMDHQGSVAVRPGPAGTTGVSITEVDQMEKTLDDVQLLKQFDSAVTESGASKAM